MQQIDSKTARDDEDRQLFDSFNAKTNMIRELSDIIAETLETGELLKDPPLHNHKTQEMLNIFGVIVKNCSKCGKR